jgi:hypothetical protein
MIKFEGLVLISIGMVYIYVVDDCSYVIHSPTYKLEINPLRGVHGSYLR